MIESMIAYTNTRTGNTNYTVVYNNGKHRRERRFRQNDNWTTPMVKFFTAEDTRRTDCRIVGYTLYEKFEK